MFIHQLIAYTKNGLHTLKQNFNFNAIAHLFCFTYGCVLFTAMVFYYIYCVFVTFLLTIPDYSDLSIKHIKVQI